jgi:threonine 3-dehydrogenase
MYETWYMMTVMLQGGLDVRPVITHRFHYTQHEEAFATVRSGEAGKVLLYWREEP